MEPMMYRVPYGKSRPGGIVPGNCAGALSASSHQYNELVIEPIDMEEEEPKVIQKTGDRAAGNCSVRQDVAYCLTANPMTDRGQTVLEPVSCAARTRAYCGQPMRLEAGGPVANALTSVQKDSMVAEPCPARVVQIGNTTPGAGVTTRENPNRGRVYSSDGIGPSLTCMQGGNLQPQVAEPQMMGHYRPAGRTSEDVPRGEYVLRPKTDGVADTLTCSAGAQERMVAEPLPQQEEPRIVGYSRDAQGRVVGRRLKDVANAVTTFTGSGFTTDQYAAEPRIENVGNAYPSGGQGGRVVAPTGLAPAVCECHGEVTRITEGMAFRNMQEKGLSNPTDADSAAPAAAHAVGGAGGQAAMVVEGAPKVECRYRGEDADKAVQAARELAEVVAARKEGGKIAVDVTADGTLRPHFDNGSNYGLMDYYAAHDGSVAGTQIATRPQQAYGPNTRYRIRKLTPRECFRLMDVSEPDIDKLVYAADEKGKPLLSKSALYKLAGNSIVESCLYLLFDKMFVHPEPTRPEIPTLF